MLTRDPLSIVLSRSYILFEVARYCPKGTQRLTSTSGCIQNFAVLPMNAELQIIKPPAAYLESSAKVARWWTSTYQRENLEVWDHTEWRE